MNVDCVLPTREDCPPDRVCNRIHGHDLDLARRNCEKCAWRLAATESTSSPRVASSGRERDTRSLSRPVTVMRWNIRRQHRGRSGRHRWAGEVPFTGRWLPRHRHLASTTRGGSFRQRVRRASRGGGHRSGRRVDDIYRPDRGQPWRSRRRRDGDPVLDADDGTIEIRIETPNRAAETTDDASASTSTQTTARARARTAWTTGSLRSAVTSGSRGGPAHSGTAPVFRASPLRGAMASRCRSSGQISASEAHFGSGSTRCGRGTTRTTHRMRRRAAPTSTRSTPAGRQDRDQDGVPTRATSVRQ